MQRYPMHATTTIAAPARLLITIAVVFGAGINLTALAWALWTRPRLNSDFLAFWSFPRFAAGNPIAAIYHAPALAQFQQGLYPGFHSFYPYLYPPTLLLVTWWLRWFTYPAAQMIWTVAGLALLLAGAWAYFGRRYGLVLAAMLASPASLLNFMTGETAYFTTGLLLLGLGLLPKRPVLAGVAFGLLTLKPQLGVLLPVLLLARFQCRACISAGATGLALVVLACLAFPASLWAVWWHSLPAYQAQYFAARDLNLNIIVTPAANLVALGLRPAAAWAVQISITLLIAAGVFAVARRGTAGLAAAALLTGGFLAVPHAYAYDTIPLTAAMALYLAHDPRPPVWVLPLGLLAYLAPLLLLSPAWHYFLYAPVEMLLFIAIIGLARRPAY